MTDRQAGEAARAYGTTHAPAWGATASPTDAA